MLINPFPVSGDTVHAVRDNATAKASILRFNGLDSCAGDDSIAVEEPLELQLTFGTGDARQTKSISVTMRTPGHDFELVSGFLMTEGIVGDQCHIADISYVHAGSNSTPDTDQGQPEKNLILQYQPERNVVRVSLEPDIRVNMQNLERNFYTTSSCGICGKASLLALHAVGPPRIADRFQISARVIYLLPDRLRIAQTAFDSTGGLHAAGLFDLTGELLSIREDVGRHNAVDKLLGAEFLADRTPLRNRLLLLSGRASFELLQKSVMGGISTVISIGAPSSLAVQAAKEFDVTLIGFLRKDHFNVYHDRNRILRASAAEDLQ